MLPKAENQFEIDVKDPGCDCFFEVSGEFKPGYPSSFTDPGEDPHIDNYTIKLDGVDVTDILADRVHDSIVEQAIETLRRE